MKLHKISLYLIIVVVSAVALSATWYFSQEGKDYLLKQQATSDAIRWANFVVTRSPDITAELRQGRISELTHDTLKLASEAGGVFRFKLFDPNGLIVQATRSSDLGKRNTKSYFNEIVRNGQTFAKMATDEKYGAVRQNYGASRIIISEAYVPLMENGRFQGAVEIYVDETKKAAMLDKAAHFVFLSVVLLVIGMATSWAFFVWRDLVGRDQAEEELRSSEALFRAFVNNSPSSISVKGLDRTYLLVNAKHAEFFGRSVDDIIGEKPHNLFNKDLVNTNLSHDNAVLEAGCAIEREEVVQVEGETKTLLTMKFPIVDGSGKVSGVGAIATDITDRKRAEQELANNRDHLQELVDMATEDLKTKAEELGQALAREKDLNEQQRKFVSMASHEFRTPLAIIDASAQRIKNQADKNRLTPVDAVQRVEKIRAAVQRMIRLVDSTLMAARIQEGKIEVTIGSCDIGKVVREVCARQQEVSKNHVISCDLEGFPVTIQADTNSLEQVLTNLLSNAVKYAPDAPDIEVMARTEGDQVVISVRDHGIGIDEVELGRIGERFFRAKTSSGIAGTGIGINLVKTLVEMHDGTVSVESQNGEGSTFTIRLPIAGPDQSEQAERSVA